MVMPKYRIIEAEQTRPDMKYRRILVCYLNLPDYIPEHLVSKSGAVERKSKDRIIFTWDEFKHTIENFKEAGDPEDEVKIYETTCLTGLSFDLMDCPEINHKGAFDQLYLARWFFDIDTQRYNLKVLRLYEHMSVVDKDIRFAHNLTRLTTGHIFDTALEKSKERLELLEKKWEIEK